MDSKLMNITREKYWDKTLNLNVKMDLFKYFYFNQYDEDKYPHFRACDRYEEYDEEGGDLLNILPTLNKYKLIFTSPPYCKNFEYDTFNSYKEYLEFMDKWINLIKDNLSTDGYFLLNIQNDTQTPIKAFEVLEIAKKYFVVVDTIIWFKYNQQPANTNKSLTNQQEYIFILRHNRAKLYYHKERVLEKYPEIFESKYVGNVWKIPFIPKKKSIKKVNGNWGSSGFPEKLCRLVIDLITEEGDKILDCFCGTGTLIEIGEEMNRIADGIDMVEY